MKRQEFLLNFTLLIVIGALVYLIYDSQDDPRTLKDLEAVATETGGLVVEARPRTKKDKAPGKETSYEVADAGEAKPDGKEGESSEDKFGKTNLFRSLLTPTPTPSPTPPPPPPTPDIGKALGAWRLLSAYEGKALIEDVQKSEQGLEGAIFEMLPGGTAQVDVGSGIMKTATLKKMDDANPYNPEIIMGLEGTEAEKKINLDTEPVVSKGAPGASPAAAPPPAQAPPAAPK